MEKSQKPIVRKELVFPFIMITSLFFLWGIANDLTNPMVSAFKKVMPELSNFEAALVQLAFYGGYATMAIPAALFIRRYSYKKGILLGLALYAVGAFLFYPAASYEQFGFFLASLYVLTFGLAFLETTANPFVLSMGDAETATQRLNLSQAFNPMGSLLGMLVAQIFVIQSLRSDDYSTEAYNALGIAEKAAIRENDLGIISYPYIALGILVLVILLIIALTKFPTVKKEAEISLKASFAKLLKNKGYYEGVIAQAFYVGAQIMCWTFIFQYVDEMNMDRSPDEQLTATWYNMAAMVLFLSGRWICTWLLKYIKSARLMLYFAMGGVICCALTILLPGILGLYALVGISICMSLMFPTIYGIALKDMGDEAKLGSAGLVMAIVGGALMPPLQAAILDWGGPGFSDVQLLGFVPEVRFSFVLPLFCLVVVGIYSYRSLHRT
ncbi:L-fucose permease [Flavobacteriaceae bacterium GF1]